MSDLLIAFCKSFSHQLTLKHRIIILSVSSKAAQLVMEH